MLALSEKEENSTLGAFQAPSRVLCVHNNLCSSQELCEGGIYIPIFQVRKMMLIEKNLHRLTKLVK